MEQIEHSSPNSQQIIHRIPVVVSDVDGVLKQRMKALSPAVIDALKIVRSPLNTVDPSRFASPAYTQHLPFILLTNRGNMSEAQHAITMNNSMSFTDTPYAFTAEENILNYTSLKPHFAKYFDRTVLLVGTLNSLSTAIDCGIAKYVTKYEYVQAFPEMFPMATVTPEQTQEARATLAARLNIEDFSEPIACAAVFVMGMPFEWEEDIQLILDLLSTEDGSVAKTMPEVGPENHIPVYIAYNDLTYKDTFNLPRIVNGGFTLSLQTTYKAVYKRDLKLFLFGKPSPAQFEFARETALKMLPPQCEVSNFYMIGDNPHTDIRGANSVGWVSILVRTGMFQGKTNDPTDPATHVVDDFYQAIKLIFQLEGLPLDPFIN